MKQAAMRERLIVGLDVPTLREAEAVVKELEGTVSFYKIGYQLAFAGGLAFARELAAGGTGVFLDMKLLDIDNTVANGVENIAKMGVSMLTIHAYPKAMRAAVAAAKGSDLCLLGVTVLTSMDEEDTAEAGYAYDPAALVLRRAEQAKAAGMGGLVCSAGEAAAIREIVGPEHGRRDARHPARRRRARRPEARLHAGGSNSGRRQPPRGGEADRPGGRSPPGRRDGSGRDGSGLS